MPVSGAGRSEKAELNDTLVGLSALPETLVYRQNTGMFWQGQQLDLTPGQYVEVEPGMVILRNARPVRAGLPGSGDIAGVHRRRALQVEMKTLTGKQREIQQNFERAWVKAGGIYILARSADEAIDRINICF